jgi:hypothetical protein
MTDLKTLYEEDTVAWAENQAAALRAAAQGGSNQELDWENLAEEIEDLAKSYRLSLKSHIRRIVQHLTKLAHSPAADPRHGWRRSTLLARQEIADILEESPSLKRDVEQLCKSVIPSGIELAIAGLREHDEINPMSERIIRRTTYTSDQILGDWFPQEPKA